MGGAGVETAVGMGVGIGVGATVGAAVGAAVGTAVGTGSRPSSASRVGAGVGCSVGVRGLGIGVVGSGGSLLTVELSRLLTMLEQAMIASPWSLPNSQARWCFTIILIGSYFPSHADVACVGVSGTSGTPG